MPSEETDELGAVRRIVRHDLRSPVAVVVGRVDLLLSELQGPLTPAQRRSIESILTSAERIEQLAADLGARIDRLWGAGEGSEPLSGGPGAISGSEDP